MGFIGGFFRIVTGGCLGAVLGVLLVFILIVGAALIATAIFGGPHHP